jgi:hypothetical protein
MFEGVFEAAVAGAIVAGIGGAVVGAVAGLITMVRRARREGTGWRGAWKAMIKDVTAPFRFVRRRLTNRGLAIAGGILGAVVLIPMVTESSILIRQSKAGLMNERTACLYFSGVRFDRRYFTEVLEVNFPNRRIYVPDCPLIVRAIRGYNWMFEPNYYEDSQLPHINLLLSNDDGNKIERARAAGYSDREIFDELVRRKILNDPKRGSSRP